MASEHDLKVFISWSRPLAKRVAEALANWLPTMFDHIEPWFSDADIVAGTTWFGEIQEHLNASDYGIIVVTTENYQQPWLNFEAGAYRSNSATRVWSRQYLLISKTQAA